MSRIFLRMKMLEETVSLCWSYHKQLSQMAEVVATIYVAELTLSHRIDIAKTFKHFFKVFMFSMHTGPPPLTQLPLTHKPRYST